MGVLGAMAALALSVAVAAQPAGATVTFTSRTYIRPVTSTGHPASGFTLHSEPNGSVDCTANVPSPAAINANIDFCSPSAEYAVACWKSAVPARALCFRNVLTKDVYRIPRTGAFHPTTLAPTQFRAPLAMKLTNGDLCTIRSGGAAGSLTGHPNLFTTYFCVHSGEIWASTSARHLGVNEAHPLWTVQTAPAGNHALVTRHVLRAWFVGNAPA
jgi:hypothetical protein